MIRRPPRATLFPTRRSSDLMATVGLATAVMLQSTRVFLSYLVFAVDESNRARLAAAAFGTRSEEHTSELQSRQYPVCRLLLEKTKTHTEVSLLTSTSTLCVF